MDWQVIKLEENENGAPVDVEIDNGSEWLTATGRCDYEWWGVLKFHEPARGVEAEFKAEHCLSFDDVKAALIQAARDKIAELNKVLESLEKFSLDD